LSNRAQCRRSGGCRLSGDRQTKRTDQVALRAQRRTECRGEVARRGGPGRLQDLSASRYPLREPLLALCGTPAPECRRRVNTGLSADVDTEHGREAGVDHPAFHLARRQPVDIEFDAKAGARGCPARIRPAGYRAGLAGGRCGGAGAWQRTGEPGCPGRVAGPRSAASPRTAGRPPAPASAAGSLSCPALGRAADDRPGDDSAVRPVVDSRAGGRQRVPGAGCVLLLCVPEAALIVHDGVLLASRRGCGVPVVRSSAGRPLARHRISDLNKTVVAFCGGWLPGPLGLEPGVAAGPFCNAWLAGVVPPARRWPL